MEKENGKKKIDTRQEQEQEDDEMEKMEQFYSLIRHFREARNCLIGSRKTQPNHEVGTGDEEPEEEPKKMKASKKRKKMGEEYGDHQGRSSSTSWVPSFEREDFADKEAVFQGTSLSLFPALPWNATANTVNKAEEKLQDDDASECLDLRLAL